MMAAAVGVLDDLSAQTITYTPRTGSARSIEAMIEYLGPAAMDGLPRGSRPQFDVTVKNHATLGIRAKDVDTGGDKLSLPMRMGRAAVTVRITKIMAQDKAMIRLRAW